MDWNISMDLALMDLLMLERNPLDHLLHKLGLLDIDWGRCGYELDPVGSDTLSLNMIHHLLLEIHLALDMLFKGFTLTPQHSDQIIWQLLFNPSVCDA